MAAFIVVQTPGITTRLNFDSARLEQKQLLRASGHKVLLRHCLKPAAIESAIVHATRTEEQKLILSLFVFFRQISTLITTLQRYAGN